MNIQTVYNDHITLDADHVDGLEERLRGPLLREDGAGYDEARQVWNGMIDKRPALIARATGTADMMDAVHFAREHDWCCAPKLHADHPKPTAQ